MLSESSIMEVLRHIRNLEGMKKLLTTVWAIKVCELRPFIEVIILTNQTHVENTLNYLGRSGSRSPALEPAIIPDYV